MTEPVIAQTNIMVTVRVLMRPPIAGERGFFVSEHATAEQALAELVADDGEIGWVASRDQPAYNEGFESKHRCVTVEVERIIES